ncbi:MAG: pyridoxal phosphate-dependent aminotransferase [Candidatus Lokiarchaeota archaeon]|nr:pyridoxal phosphate-dependent aminotransferase [Candidatus Lokiarchaeota archaeon]
MFAKRIESIRPFIVMEVLEKALEMEHNGIDIIHMEIGEPDFETPKRIVEGCFTDLGQGKTHYTHSLGMLELREALSKYKEKTRSTRFDPKTQFMITGGTSPAFFNVFSVLLNPGDEVIIADPGYPCYQNFARFFGAKPIYLPIMEEDKFDLDVGVLKKLISPKTKAIILNSPSNPTGQIISRESLDEISMIVKENDFWIISDEIYAELTYNGEIAPSLSEKDYKSCHNRLVVLDGFSKFWAMTGWRLGYVIAPPNLIGAMTPVQQNFSICAPSISQSAAIHALTCTEETKNMLDVYKDRRDYVVNFLNKLKGINCLVPNGAFYAFANIKELGISSISFCMTLLENARVAACPGASFGPNGEGYVRFSYTTGKNNIRKGMERLESFLENIN